MADREEPIIMVIMAEAVSFKDSGGDKFMELNRIVVCILQLGWLKYGSQLVCALTTSQALSPIITSVPPRQNPTISAQQPLRGKSNSPLFHNEHQV